MGHKNGKMVIADFDGTLIRCDSLALIMKRERWFLHPDLLAAGIQLAITITLHRKKEYQARCRFKYLLLKKYHALSLEKRNQYISLLRHELNRDLIREIRDASPDRIVVASASESTLIKEVLRGSMKPDLIIANDADSAVKAPMSSFRTCWGEEKASRFQAAVPDYRNFETILFTDSDSDRPMMQIVDSVIME